MPLAERRAQLSPPHDLSPLRASILAIPGASAYADTGIASPEATDQQIERMVDDINKQFRAENTQKRVTFDLGWSDAHAAKIFNTPEHAPYKSAVTFAETPQAKMEQLLTIGRFLRTRYEQARTANTTDTQSDEERNAEQRLRIFYEESIKVLFSEEEFEFKDRYNGIDHQARKNGPITGSTQEMQELIAWTTHDVAAEFETDEEQLSKDVLRATEGGYFAPIITFLQNFQGTPALRRVLEKVYEDRAQDTELAIQKLQLLSKVEAYRLEIGIDLDTLYRINRFPTPETVTASMEAFSTQFKFTSEVAFHHMVKETPNIFDQASKYGYTMKYWDIMAERAVRSRKPVMPPTMDQFVEIANNTDQQIMPLFPFDLGDKAAIITDSLLSPGATPRGFTQNYRTRAGGILNFIGVNGRDLGRYLEIKPHELGHALSDTVMVMAELAGDIPRGSYERFPEARQEEVAAMLEDQARKWFKKYGKSTHITNEPTPRPPRRPLPHPPKPAPGSLEWGHLLHALIMRRQAPVARIQLAARQYIEERWSPGKKEMNREEALDMLTELQPKTEAWYQQGLRIVGPFQYTTFNIEPTAPFDGANYMKDYMPVEQQTSESAKPTHMKDLFQKTWGDKDGIWVTNPDAWTIFLAYLGDIARPDFDPSTSEQFISKSDPEELRQKFLTRWGIKATVESNDTIG